jgi:4-diphosphocytidyl-2-C-methyl-D-erythritol kinase
MAAKERNGPAAVAGPALIEQAFAKINLSLRIIGRRVDGYHAIESLVAFADISDRLALRPDEKLELSVMGPTAAQAGAVVDNIVLKAARALVDRVEGLRLGQFGLIKRLPAGAGLGGGSADAAAALRLLARLNNIALGDSRMREAALAAGADVPVCLEQKPRWMCGVGDVLSGPVELPRQFAVVVHPGVPVATRAVFDALSALPCPANDESGVVPVPGETKELVNFLAQRRNDLEPAAIKLCPIISDVLAALSSQPGCALARMSGSGSACFGLFPTSAAAALAARSIASDYPAWWVQAATIGAV